MAKKQPVKPSILANAILDYPFKCSFTDPLNLKFEIEYSYGIIFSFDESGRKAKLTVEYFNGKFDVWLTLDRSFDEAFDQLPNDDELWDLIKNRLIGTPLEWEIDDNLLQAIDVNLTQLLPAIEAIINEAIPIARILQRYFSVLEANHDSLITSLKSTPEPKI